MSAMEMKRANTAVRGLDTEDIRELEKGTSQVVMGVIIAMAGMLGSGGLLCLVSAITGEAGILGAARGWIRAVTGM